MLLRKGSLEDGGDVLAAARFLTRRMSNSPIAESTSPVIDPTTCRRIRTDMLRLAY